MISMDRRELLASVAATIAMFSAGSAKAATGGVTPRTIAIFQAGLEEHLMAAQAMIARDASGTTEIVRIAGAGILDVVALNERLAPGGQIRLVGIVAPANRALLVDTVRWHSGRILPLDGATFSDELAQQIITAEIS